jgi:uncharacterized protein YcbK (DUF882 family)
LSSEQPVKEQTLPSRRKFFAFGLAAATATLISSKQAWAALPSERRLSFHHLHTGERINAVYWADGRYVPESLREIDNLMRDFRTDQVKHMDPRVLDILYALGRTVECTTAFTVIGGYRSPATNAMLREKGSGVAKHSLHLKGQAVDLSLPGCNLSHLHRAALSLEAGGVGYYPSSDFIHVDCGPIRHW